MGKIRAFYPRFEAPEFFTDWTSAWDPCFGTERNFEEENFERWLYLRILRLLNFDVGLSEWKSEEKPVAQRFVPAVCVCLATTQKNKVEVCWCGIKRHGAVCKSFVRVAFCGELGLWKGCLVVLKAMYDAGSRAKLEVSATCDNWGGRDEQRPAIEKIERNGG